MKSTLKVSSVLIFGIALSLLLPNVIVSSTSKHLKDNSAKKVSTSKQTKSEMIAMNTEKDTAVPVEVTPVVQEVVEQPVVAPEPVQKKQTVSDQIVYDGMTLNQLSEKLNRSLKSTLAGTGASFAKHAVEMGVDPYLAVAIVLHETGCSYSCSNQVKTCNNVGGMKGSPGCNGTSYKHFDSLDAGIYGFMYNLKTNYYDKGLTTAEAMNSKYAASTTWSAKVNYYIEKIKAA